ncbi:MAG: cation diffusion facilitator family transporter [Gammaproteobacteria bacterium]|nr:cation diffusion facilitator family transporter [Gammaproteobacteria bacterium]MDH5801291.1 cation diffusion facilitator family transporter [Gammaproteobacteria bacterium]
MGHSHDQHHHDHLGQHHHSAISNLKLAFFLNLGFTVIEFIGGMWTNSTAILADAVHDLGDSFALAQAWYFESVSGKEATKKYTYGYRRFTLLGAVISALVLLLSSFYVLSEAIPRIVTPESSNAQGMVMLALLGVGVNGFAMLRLAKGQSENIKVVALHLLEDVLGWVAILVVAVILLFKDVPVLDPILAVLITVYILANVVKRLKQILPVFLQATPDSASITSIEQQIESLEWVDSVHHLHLWSLDGERAVLTAHIVTGSVLTSEEYANLKQRLRSIVDTHGVYHSTFEIEWPDETCRLEHLT